MKKYIFITILILGFVQFVAAQNYDIMTYNIRYSNSHDGQNKWKKRKEYLCDQISYYNPDVFGIQEGLHSQVIYLDNYFKDYKYVGIGRDDAKTKGEYSAIFYNATIFNVLESDTFWLSKTPEKISVGWDAAMERICTYVLLKDKKTGTQFYVFNTHFDHRGTKARINSAKLIAKKIARINKDKLPVFLMGDFNLLPDSKPIQFLSKEFNDSKLSTIHKPFGPDGTFNGFKFDKPVTDRIDYIFTSIDNVLVHKFAVISDSKDCKYPSDHFPILVTVSFE
ncbi:MAG: endonuclease/exonuclease/phosphatase [Flavobacteriaceae bacterium]|nr:MAG: endonuclease/exonuclease/phosphatase [Flavobacteriaceae bacterium]